MYMRDRVYVCMHVLEYRYILVNVLMCICKQACGLCLLAYMYMDYVCTCEYICRQVCV